MGDVALSVPSQSFKGTLMVGLGTTIPGAEIRYTIDGTLPTATSTVYASPLMLTSTTQVRAQPFVSGTAAGLVTTGLYIARSFDLTSQMPIVLLDDYGKGASTSKTTYLDAAVMIFEPVNGTASLANLPTVATRAAFHLRGQSSASFPQKPYKIEFRDNADADAKYAIAGMPADADWALIAPYYDRAIMRNPFTYTLGRDMGLMAPRTANVEVYLNFTSKPVAETDYQGIYWLSETIKINGHRMDMADLKAADVTAPADHRRVHLQVRSAGDRRHGAPPHLQGDDGRHLLDRLRAHRPRPPPRSHRATRLHHRLRPELPQHALHHADRQLRPVHRRGVVRRLPHRQRADPQQRRLQPQRVLQQGQGRPPPGGPLWDYNFALGVGTTVTASPAPLDATDGGWQFQGATPGSLPRRNTSGWYPKLMADPAFLAKVKTRWKSLRQGLLSQAQIEARHQHAGRQAPRRVGRAGLRQVACQQALPSDDGAGWAAADSSWLVPPTPPGRDR